VGEAVVASDTAPTLTVHTMLIPKKLLSAFFNLRLRRGVQAVKVENPSLLNGFARVFAAVEALGFTDPIIRGGAVRDALEGGEINDFDVYVSRLRVRDGILLPSIEDPGAPDFYAAWLSERLGISGIKGHAARVTERPHISFEVRCPGIERSIDLVVNDEMLSPEMLALEADATMNGVAASRDRIAAHPLFLPDLHNHIYRPTCARVGNLISAPMRYSKFASRDPKLKYRLF
jgi:hypothetical protein